MSLIQINVPDIGDFKEVEVIELLVKPGDTVKAEQSLITVESDKASMEIPSSHAGVVKELKIKVGDKVAEGSLILMLEAADTAPATAAPAAATTSVAAATVAVPVAAAAVALNRRLSLRPCQPLFLITVKKPTRRRQYANLRVSLVWICRRSQAAAPKAVSCSTTCKAM